jgi:hypothetical protein
MPSDAAPATGGGSLFGGPLDEPGWLFLHERRASPSSAARLILVRVSATGILDNQAMQDSNVSQVRTSRQLTSYNIIPATAETDLSIAAADYLGFGSDPKFTKVPVKLDPGDGTEPVLVDFHGQLRFLAGQPDESDPARFTIPYELDGVRGTIVGTLFANDHIRFETHGPLESLVK